MSDLVGNSEDRFSHNEAHITGRPLSGSAGRSVYHAFSTWRYSFVFLVVSHWVGGAGGGGGGRDLRLASFQSAYE